MKAYQIYRHFDSKLAAVPGEEFDTMPEALERAKELTSLLFSTHSVVDNKTYMNMCTVHPNTASTITVSPYADAPVSLAEKLAASRRVEEEEYKKRLEAERARNLRLRQRKHAAKTGMPIAEVVAKWKEIVEQGVKKKSWNLRKPKQPTSLTWRMERCATCKKEFKTRVPKPTRCAVCHTRFWDRPKVCVDKHKQKCDDPGVNNASTDSPTT